MNRRRFLGGMAAALGAGSRRESFSLPGQAAARAPRTPNIVFILADDLGYGDLGCYGQKQIATPNIDRLTAEGLRFTQAYAGSTVCAPSRCALMTGLHTGHAHIRGNALVPLRPQDTTVTELLKRAGYHTGIFGKWGLGEPGTTGVPNAKGFEEWYGYLNQQHAHNYYPESLWENDRQVFLTGNWPPARRQYSHDQFSTRALGFIERHRNERFFLYLAYTIPHANNELGNQTGNGMEVPSDAPYSDRDWPQVEKNFAAMVTRLDNDVGRFMGRLRDLGLDRDTIVFFTSDNGPHREGGHNPDFFHSSGPLRGIKRDLYEGGIRMPMIARWPGTIEAGRTSDDVWAFWDFLPTACELASIAAPAGLDGRSVVPSLLGRRLTPHEYLYWEFHEGGFTQALRMGDWKAVRKGTKAPIELYDLRGDLGEKNDVAAAHPDVVARISEILNTARTDSPEFPIRETPAAKKA
jgi:arylsulfatase A-like enzyme